jgi:hypothetical protein
MMGRMSEELPGSVSVAFEMKWQPSVDAPRGANQFLLQIEPNGDQTPGTITIVAGWVAQPRVIGTLDSQQHELAQIREVEIEEVAQFTTTRQRAGELHELLGRVLAIWDAAKATTTTEGEDRAVGAS